MQFLLALVTSTWMAFFASPPFVSSAKIDPKDKGEPLFPKGHPNITYLTDENWDQHMKNKSDKPWLVNFYHPFCPHCKFFAPAYVNLAAYYTEKGNLYLGAVSCMDHVKCRRVEITGFPTLMAINFDKRYPNMENKRIVGTYTVIEIKEYVNSVFAEADFNETGTWPPGYIPPQNKTKEKEDAAAIDDASRPPLWEESTLPMNQTTRIQDAASAFVFGLKQGAFMASDVMDDEEFDALKGWLKMVSKTFPGAINRKLITSLYEKVKVKELLDFDTWDAIVKAWQKGSVAAFKAEEARYDYTGVDVPEWQRLNDLFTGQGATYRACALYTCGQWTMFHMLTLNPPETGARTGELMVSVAASIRRFVKHFFGCVDCRDHFLKENTVAVVKKIKDTEDKPLALRRWLWEQHNSVNKRLNHPLWPKPEICPTCGTEGRWEMVEVDKWLSHTFGYRDVVVPLVKGAEQAVDAVPPVVALRYEAEEEAEAPSIAQASKTEAKETAAVEESKLKTEVKETAAPEESKLKTEAKETAATKESKLTTKVPVLLEPKGGDAYRPKDAELGIKNAANTKELVVNMKHELEDGLQGITAPPVTLFAWYILPVAAVGGYLLFVRYRATKQKAFRQVQRK
ncbi:unnamed protein product [Peronospora belbahrii]|uniref:Sulfhydryl oxidase n=1 Tax=Peronospora belbahrii TaxID=622444 RepID=A0AAU9LAQ7_9STRA|nr:unnamed protein product [Peronospora belbahrii]CAH0513582.1 unnamed protein product [Peronospora belbahrii]